MTVAFDAISTDGGVATGNLSWTHTPAGTPRGVIVFVVQQPGSTNEILSVDYGGTAMSPVSGSPLLYGSGETGAVYAFFLGSSIPTGAQTITVNVNGTGSSKFGAAYSVTASADTEIVDVDSTVATIAANPSVTLSLGGRDCFCCEAFLSGHGSVLSTSPFSNWTANDLLLGGGSSRVAGFYRYDTIDDVDVTAGWTQTSEDAAMIAVAISEAAAVATTYTFTGPSSGTVNVASTDFTVTPDGDADGIEVTPATDGSGSFTPSSVTFTGSGAETFTYTPTDTAGSPHTLSVTNDGALTDPDDIDYTVNPGPLTSYRSLRSLLRR